MSLRRAAVSQETMCLWMYMDCLRAVLQTKTWQVLSSYSGIGGAEAAMRALTAACAEFEGGPKFASTLRSVQARVPNIQALGNAMFMLRAGC